MKYRCMKRILLTVSLIALLAAGPAIRLSNAQSTTQSTTASNKASRDGLHGVGKQRWSRETIARDRRLWHSLNQRRLDQTHPLGAAALMLEAVSQDIGDITVIQGDNNLVTPPNAFNLAGRTVQFTPDGGGYTIASGTGVYDTNFGAKLNLAAPPAVNPKSDAIPGDDAYIFESLGFTFNFYGSGYSTVAVTSNGDLVFNPGGLTQSAFDLAAVDSGESLATLQEGLPRIAPYWHDLDARAIATQGSSGVYFRRDNDRVLVTWNNIQDFPNDPKVDTGVERFQVTLFNDGRIFFTYDAVQLTSTALAGISPGNSQTLPDLDNLANPPSAISTAPIADLFSTMMRVDDIGAIQAFYATHPNQDVYDFVYFATDFDFDLGDAIAFYLPIRNDVSGIGLRVFDFDPAGRIGAFKIQGELNLGNILDYPDLPTTRFLGSNHAYSVMAQEQGHRWLADVAYPDVRNLLLGRDNEHWSFFFNTESNVSNAAARRSSSMEGNVWRDNGDGSFTSVGLIDGYSRLDQYLMGLRPASDVADSFEIVNLTNSGGATRSTGPTPDVTVTGQKLAITIGNILAANGSRTPNSTVSQKNFRTAIVLLTRPGNQPSQATLDKIALYRLGWESYFGQSTDYLATLNTGLSDLSISRVVAATSAASFQATLAPGAIASLFGAGLASDTAIASSQPLPTTLLNTQVLINGAPAPLFFISPTQLNFEVPVATFATTASPSVQSATAVVEVISNGQLVHAGAFQIAPTVPAIFTLSQNGIGPAAAVDAVTGAGAPFNAVQSNGQPNMLSLYGAGLGADATDMNGNVSASVQVTIDGVPVTVNYAGQAPGFTGLNQINFTLPAGVTSGTHTVVVARNGVASNPTTVAIQ